MARLVPKNSFKQLLAVSLVLLAGGGLLGSLLLAASNDLLSRSVKLSDSRATATATYKFSFQPPGLDTIQTIAFEFCANDPMVGASCTPPAGFDASAATLVDQTGDVGFSISGQSNANKLIIDRSPLASDGQPSSYTFDGLVNPSSNGSYYLRISTYPDSTNSGLGTYNGGLAFAINDAVGLTAVVPPYLQFCVGITIAGYTCDDVQGDYVNFGEFSSRQASQGSTQMLAATNAKDGYNIRVLGNTLTSGTNFIPALSSNDVSRPGVSQFGMNLRTNSAPQGGLAVSGPGAGQPVASYDTTNFFQFNSGDVVAASVLPDEARKYTTSYIVNIQKGQAPGVYVSTLTYVALGSY